MGNAGTQEERIPWDEEFDQDEFLRVDEELMQRTHILQQIYLPWAVARHMTTGSGFRQYGKQCEQGRAQQPHFGSHARVVRCNAYGFHHSSLYGLEVDGLCSFSPRMTDYASLNSIIPALVVAGRLIKLSPTLTITLVCCKPCNSSGNKADKPHADEQSLTLKCTYQGLPLFLAFPE